MYILFTVNSMTSICCVVASKPAIITMSALEINTHTEACIRPKSRGWTDGKPFENKHVDKMYSPLPIDKMLSCYSAVVFASTYRHKRESRTKQKILPLPYSSHAAWLNRFLPQTDYCASKFTISKFKDANWAILKFLCELFNMHMQRLQMCWVSAGIGFLRAIRSVGIPIIKTTLTNSKHFGR